MRRSPSPNGIGYQIGCLLPVAALQGSVMLTRFLGLRPSLVTFYATATFLILAWIPLKQWCREAPREATLKKYRALLLAALAFAVTMSLVVGPRDHRDSAVKTQGK